MSTRRAGAFDMTHQEIASSRLASQHIARKRFTKVHELVGFMGAVQAQDYPMARWAIGTRLPQVTDKGVERALAKGEIVRLHLLRPTWHIVAARDVRWLLALTAPTIRSSMGKRHRDLGLAAPVISRCNRALEKALASAGAMTREEIARLLEKNGIATNEDNRLAHILMLAELDGVVCSGPPRANKPTYALLDERVPATKTVEREDGLAELARRYFTSRGPASLRDFQWWSGLTVGDARLALSLAGESLDSETAHSETNWFSRSIRGDWGRDRDVHLLPAYDELLISYRDRSASLGSRHHARTVSSNGLFRPTVIVEGRVEGLWKGLRGADGIVLEADFFHPPNRKTRESLARAARAYARFLGRRVDIADSRD